MSTIIGADAAKLAGLQIDILQKVRTGQMTLDHLERFSYLTFGQREALFRDMRKPEPACPPPVEKKTAENGTNSLNPITEITVEAISAKATKDCFTTPNRYYHRDGDLDRWLPKNQPAEIAGKFSVSALTKQLRFKQMAQIVLGITADILTLAKGLIERRHTTNLTRIDTLIERQENAEAVGLLTNGSANFFFVEDKDGSVSVVNASRNDRQWHVNVYRLDDGFLWRVGRRLFVRNSDSVSL